jgi:DNA (cytosine-5)-methyltransferase 1
VIKKPLLSLFCGAGGMDLGFEQAGFEIGAAFDIRCDAVASYNGNRERAIARVTDIRKLEPEAVALAIGVPFGIIGGPPCQSFSIANSAHDSQDPRHRLPFRYARVIADLNQSNGVSFFVFENVPGLLSKRYAHRFAHLRAALSRAGFNVTHYVLDAKDYCVPQTRQRLFVVGINKHLYRNLWWQPPTPSRNGEPLSVRAAIGGLPEPTHFGDYSHGDVLPFHANHWCMTPKSQKFVRRGALVSGSSSNRSFKVLSWEKPSLTVSYGNREVHIHPDCHRRLSVFEAMRLQGFPDSYALQGTLSSQITQVSEAVPPPLARAVADSLHWQLAQAEAPARMASPVSA